jgi:cytochrome c biogenesis factor
VIQVFINPLVEWVWIGGVVMFLGTLLALVPSRVEREMKEIRRKKADTVEAQRAG